MTLREALHWASQKLAGYSEAALEAELLLRKVVDLSQAQLYARFEQELAPESLKTLDALLERRLQGEPIAYILGRWEFFGLDFAVDSRVLIPRPETEHLVEKALELAKTRTGRPLIADIGTGSGAIAVSLAVHLPEARIYATDLSLEALAMAEDNCRRHGVQERVILLQGDLVEPLPEAVDILVANLPYVSSLDLMVVGEPLAFVPSLALDGGPEGLDVIQRFLERAAEKLKSGGIIVLEIGSWQGKPVMELAQHYFPEATLELSQDMAGLDRVVVIRT